MRLLGEFNANNLKKGLCNVIGKELDCGLVDRVNRWQK